MAGFANFRQLTLIICLAFPSIAHSIERVIGLPDMGKRDIRQVYFTRVMIAALDNTNAEYGPYEIIKPNLTMSSQRMMAELTTGDNLSVGISSYKPSWEGQTLIVPVPLIRGLASYRLFLAKTSQKEKLLRAISFENLKTFSYGQGHGWSTAKILEDHDFKVVYGANYQGLFKMLLANRFDLFMRSAHEIILEKPLFGERKDDIFVVDTFALYTYLPTYFHVTKRQPALAKRLEEGLNIMYSTGEIDSLLTEYFTEAIEMILQPGRKIYRLKNTNLKAGTYERDSPYLMKLNMDDD